jgi:hypothetical protein
MAIEGDTYMHMKQWCVIELLNAENIAAVQAFEETL